MLWLCSENRRIAEADWKTGCNSFRLAWWGQVGLTCVQHFRVWEIHVSHACITLAVDLWCCLQNACFHLLFKISSKKKWITSKICFTASKCANKVYLYFELISWTNKTVLLNVNYCMNLRKLISSLLLVNVRLSFHATFTEAYPKNKQSTCAKWFLFDLLLSQKHTEYTSS